MKFFCLSLSYIRRISYICKVFPIGENINELKSQIL